jgi:hypothetical protein
MSFPVKFGSQTGALELFFAQVYAGKPTLQEK